MNNGKHKSFKSVLWRLKKHPFCSDLSEEQAAEYALELIRKAKLALSFGDEPAYVCVNNYRGAIPNDLIYIKGIRYYTSNDIIDYIKEETPDFIKQADINSFITPGTNFLPVKYSGNIYHSSYHKHGKEYNDVDCNITYTVNNNHIYLSEVCGLLEVSYKSLLMDEEGYPLIPDNQAYEDALYYYILKEHLFGLWTVGKVTDKAYNKIEQEYTWAIGQAGTSMKLSGMDNWETVMTGIRRLIQPQNLSDYGYKELHNREQIKKRF